ncbi:putative 39S ribosomal protein L32, mitochondrial [Hypsibius exemplaris]|uniref:Large ribosomal subunit protein bL32m n=1 Tax=Hypsibius exemplaris TaxID=2072580 RepID=A0A9X6RMT1_HYPEX|nr:putative 39S ribosomal protein L32, mitochondrial [Hypsibius exemplaris]
MFSLRITNAVRRVQELVDIFLIGGRYPGFPQLVVADTGYHPSASSPATQATTEPEQSFLESLKDGLLWAVPKKRSSVERRLKKQFGSSYMDPYKLRTDLIVCLHCGHYHEAHSLCGHCYQKVKAETKLIHDTMDITARDAELQSQEVVVVYEGENPDPVTTHGKRIVEVPKKRPLWFNSVLLTKVLPKGGAANDQS